eukprot:GHVT01078523.1.p1 GENE.GHVT01078523.1~~GHVT01078523.1.p1  ORF type:complete len:619 (-),score=159.27 GHVT01078523.1:725-2581(-)
MIDSFTIFTRGGIVLWAYNFISFKKNPVDALIRTVLMEERGGESVAQVGKFRMTWKLANKFDLVFLIIFQGIQPLSYLRQLLSDVSSAFCLSLENRPKDWALAAPSFDFDSSFLRIYKATPCTSAHNVRGRPGANRRQSADGPGAEAQGRGSAEEEAEEGEAPDKLGLGTQRFDRTDAPTADAKAEHKLTTNAAAKFKAPAPFKKKVDKLQPAKNEDQTNAKINAKKMARSWATTERVTARTMAALDCSRDVAVSEEWAEGERRRAASSYGVGGGQEVDEEEDEEADEYQDDDANKTQTNTSNYAVSRLFSSLTSKLQNVIGNKVLTKEDVDPLLCDLRAALMSKNVASEIADQLAASVSHSLVGQQTAFLTSVQRSVHTAMTEAVERLLTPKRSIDVLRDALAARARQQVYSIVFLGVNGVGKSTNLAKVCYYLKQKGGLKVMIAACDTFRSGAVEQLRTHARCLDVHLFERGYGRDAAFIAKEALAYAAKEHFDVVLVDTAGRMQDNEPLMRALAKLVAVNQPDLVLFVGEALVGNDAVDQLRKFHLALIDFSSASDPRTVDGILLTKFDTVDENVGAALSMVYVTGQPIVFVGTGQKYTNLRKLRPAAVVKALLS